MIYTLTVIIACIGTVGFGVICWYTARVLWQIGWAACAGASMTRFMWRVGVVHGYTRRKLPRWVYYPRVFLAQWWFFLDCTPGSVSTDGQGGCWYGIGQWTVFPFRPEFVETQDE